MDPDILVVTNRENLDYVRATIADRYHLTKVRKILAGGKERYDSVYAGLRECENTDMYLSMMGPGLCWIRRFWNGRWRSPGLRCVCRWHAVERYHKNRG